MKKLFTLFVAFIITSNLFAQQIPNSGFETWQTKVGIGFTGPYTYEIPQNWELGMISDLLAGFGMKPNVGKGAPSLSGNFALKLNSTADSIGADAQSTFGLPFNSHPDALVGSFRTSGVVTDSDDYGQALVFMTKWNGTKRDTIGFGSADLGSSPNAYASFTAPIQYFSSQLPDSAITYFLYFPNEANTNILIDNISFISLLGTEKEAAASKLNLYPNPVTSKATLTFNAAKAGKATLTVRDLSGKTVKTLPLPELTAGLNSVTIALEDLKKGFYLATLESESGTQTLRFLKQ